MKAILNTRTLILATAITGASSAFAGDIFANYSFALDRDVNFKLNGNTKNDQATVQFRAVRTGGTDTIVDHEYKAYCVELAESIGSGNQHHNNVTTLLGSTTTSGVLFDAVRTRNLQLLWGNAFSLIGSDAKKSAAFQLAQWEITFDDDLSLSKYGATHKLYVKDDQYQSGITNVARDWLEQIRNNNWTQQKGLVLLSGHGIQDLVTTVPEPTTIGVLAVGGLALLRRKRK